MGCGSSSPTISKQPQPSSKSVNDTEITELEDDDFFLEGEKAAIVHYNNSRNLDDPPKQSGRYNHQSDINSNQIQQKPVVKQVKTQHKSKQIQSKNGESLLIEAIEDEEIPSVHPTHKRKKDLVPDISIFKAIDEHAAKAPKSARQTVEELSKYLSRPAKNHLEAVRAFYKWIQLNIRYDAESYFSGSNKPCDSDAVLRLGSTVCSGYSNLFADLCKHAGVKVRCIHGYAKGYSYNPKEGFSLKERTNHAWNVVFLSGEWYFVECTWGTGHIKQREFVRENKEYWFLTEPEYFINDHFPYMDSDMKASQTWQLLQKPMDFETFNKRVNVQPRSHEYGITYSNNDAVLSVKEKLKMTINTSGKPLEKFNATLTHEDGTDCNKYVMSELVDFNKYIVTVKPPSQSNFKLKISGNNRNENLVHQLVTFVIKCDKVEANLMPFPELFGVWGAATDVTEYGFSESINSHIHHIVDSGEKEIHLSVLKETGVLAKLYHAEKDIYDIDSFVMLSSTHSSIIAKLRLPEEGYYKLTIFSKHLDSNENSYNPIINLLVECRKAMNPCYAFPKVHAPALKHQVTLIEPLMRDIPANAETTFVFSSRILKTVLAAKKIIEKPSSGRWEFSVITPGIGEKFGIFGSDTEGEYKGLFEFKTV